jgi:hypothetical protein
MLAQNKEEALVSCGDKNTFSSLARHSHFRLITNRYQLKTL